MPLRLLLALALASTAAAAARADIVTLQGGKQVEGKVVEEGGEVRVETDIGIVIYPKSWVVSIERKATPQERYEAREKEVDRADPGSLRAMAVWCRENRFGAQAHDWDLRAAAREKDLAAQARAAEWVRRREAVDRTSPESLEAFAGWCVSNAYIEEGNRAREQARAVRLEARLDALPAGDAEAAYKLALWLDGAGYPATTVRSAYESAVRADPNHEAAQAALGRVFFRGQWLPAAEAQAVQDREYTDAMRARGLVFFRGAWLTSDEERLEREAILHDAAEAERRDAEDARGAAQRMLDQVRAESRELDDRRRTLDDRETRLTSRELDAERRENAAIAAEARADQKLDEAERMNRDLEARAREAERAAAAADARAEGLDRENARMADDITAARSDADRLRDRIERRDALIGLLGQILAEAEHRLHHASQEAYDDYRRDLGCLFDRICHLRGALDDE